MHDAICVTVMMIASTKYIWSEMDVQMKKRCFDAIKREINDDGYMLFVCLSSCALHMHVNRSCNRPGELFDDHVICMRFPHFRKS